MKKLFLSLALMAGTLHAMAQYDDAMLQNLDTEEDTTNVTRVRDIVAMQQKVLSSSNTEKHLQDVWKRRAFFNISWNKQTLKSKNEIPTEYGAQDYKFKNDWGIGLQAGVNYRLHKKPIANMVNFCLDYSWLDLNVHHYKAEKDYHYNSSPKFYYKDKEYFYMPWGLEKYEANYGMSLGPSITVAPFVPLGIKGLDYLRIQFYYHLGYSASIIYSLNDKDLDLNTQPDDAEKKRYETMSNNLKLSWGHGLYNSFGFNVTWKRIGIGYEVRKGSYRYKAVNTDDFSGQSNKFSATNKRFYIQIRM